MLRKRAVADLGNVQTDKRNFIAANCLQLLQGVAIYLATMKDDPLLTSRYTSGMAAPTIKEIKVTDEHQE